MKNYLYKLIFIKLMGWKIVGNLNPEIKKSIIMIMPHTSNHDFYIGVLTRGILDVEINWVGKKELFRFPFATYFKYMGGAPLDRNGKQNRVDAIADIFTKREVFRLAITPEGTRKKVSRLKTGFYYIAVKAGVPIIPVAFDYKKKEINFGEPVIPTNNFESDMKILLNHFEGVKGKNTDWGYL